MVGIVGLLDIELDTVIVGVTVAEDDTAVVGVV